MIPAPSHGTNDRWNSQCSGRAAYSPGAPWQKPPDPTHTSPPDYADAGANKGISHARAGSCERPHVEQKEHWLTQSLSVSVGLNLYRSPATRATPAPLSLRINVLRRTAHAVT